MGRAIIGGVITSTLLTLVVVPVLYSYLVRERPAGAAEASPGGGAMPAHMPASKDLNCTRRGSLMTITIRRASPKDAAAYARMMSDPAVFSGLMQLPYPDEELWRTRLSDTCAPGKTDLPLAAELNGEVVGSAGLHPVGPALRRRHALTLGHLGSAPGAGQGRGLCPDGRDVRLRRPLGGCIAHGAHRVHRQRRAAIHLYRKFGFEIEGTFKGYAMRDGQFADAHSMARFHPSPPSIARV